MISFPDASAPSEDSRLAELCSLSVQSGLTEVLRTHEYIDSVIFWILLPQSNWQRSSRVCWAEHQVFLKYLLEIQISVYMLKIQILVYMLDIQIFVYIWRKKARKVIICYRYGFLCMC